MKLIDFLFFSALSNTAYAEQALTDTLKSNKTSEVTVYTVRNDYKIDTSISVAKMSLKDIENPQVYNVISKNLIKDQQITNLNNALKNATGITRLWENTGRGGDGAEYYSMRGFSLQPTLMNGMPNITNGNIDPANIERIEIIKGPSGTLYGGSVIGYGGLINIVTKRPTDKKSGELGLVTGSNSLSRFTADINHPINKTTSFRINIANHYEKGFQNAGFNKSLYVAPSLNMKISERLTLYMNSEFKNAESANNPMIFLNRNAKLSFNSIDIFKENYNNAYSSNALTINNPSYSFQTEALYQINKNWTSQTIVSRSHTKTDGFYHYLWDATNGNEFTRFISKRKGETNTLNIQQNFNGDFKIGSLNNKFLIGLDYLNNKVENYSTGWVANGTVSLLNRTDNGILTQEGVNQILRNSTETNSIAETKILGIYLSYVIYLTQKLSAMTSLRYDNFTGNPSIYSSNQLKAQNTLSPKIGLVYQPILGKLSFFGNYMNGFRNLAPVQVAEVNGSNARLKILDPEQANQLEVGFKTSLLKDRISITTSYYNIKVSNKAMMDPNNVNNTIQGGEVQSKGFEISLITSPIEGLSIVSGFSHNDTKITQDIPSGGYLGLRPEESGPQNLFNFWANYRLQSTKLKGLSIGFGSNYGSEHKTLNRANIGTFTLPSYTIFNAAISYTSSQFILTLKGDNLGDTRYFTGWSTVTAQRPRSVSLGLTFKM